MALRVRCKKCQRTFAPGATIDTRSRYCTGCYKPDKKKAEYVRKRRQFPGDNAADRLRRRLRKDGEPVSCQHCRNLYDVRLTQVDHIQPLWEGGQDINANLQILCIPCHRKKTATEAGRRAQLRKDPRA